MRRSMRRRVLATLAVSLAVTLATTTLARWHPAREPQEEISADDLELVAKWKIKDPNLSRQWNLQSDAAGTMHALDAVDPDWQLVALQGESYYVPVTDENRTPTGMRLQRYGDEDAYTYKWSAAGEKCDFTFSAVNRDPAPSRMKRCEVLWRYVNCTPADQPGTMPVPVPADGNPHWAAYGDFETDRLVHKQFSTPFACTAKAFGTKVIPGAYCAVEDTHVDQTHFLAGEGQQFTVNPTSETLTRQLQPGWWSTAARVTRSTGTTCQAPG